MIKSAVSFPVKRDHESESRTKLRLGKNYALMKFALYRKLLLSGIDEIDSRPKYDTDIPELQFNSFVTVYYFFFFFFFKKVIDYFENVTDRQENI